MNSNRPPGSFRLGRSACNTVPTASAYSVRGEQPVAVDRLPQGRVRPGVDDMVTKLMTMTRWPFCCARGPEMGQRRGCPPRNASIRPS